MQTLYPIIRRVRRSLVVTEAVADTQGTGAHGVPRPTLTQNNQGFSVPRFWLRAGS